jgi:hypothetical protein
MVCSRLAGLMALAAEDDEIGTALLRKIAGIEAPIRQARSR